MNACGCKGIRTCALCKRGPWVKEDMPSCTYTLCPHCHVAYSNHHKCHDFVTGEEFSFNDVCLIDDFVNEQEEAFLIESMSRNTWALSQSGRLKQDYGPKVNFKRQRVSVGRFTGLPDYSRFLVDRINDVIAKTPSLRQSVFYPVELCNLQYCPDRGACIVPHLDDVWLWGDRLITLNLLSSTVLTFTLPKMETHESRAELKRLVTELSSHTNVQMLNDVTVRVPLARRSLVIVDGPARNVWLHEIRAADITDKRIAMTFRELSSLFIAPPGKEAKTDEEIMGQKLQQIASTYRGVVCS